jgi:hypothetical protein
MFVSIYGPRLDFLYYNLTTPHKEVIPYPPSGEADPTPRDNQ